jgi:hypothetical protein
MFKVRSCTIHIPYSFIYLLLFATPHMPLPSFITDKLLLSKIFNNNPLRFQVTNKLTCQPTNFAAKNLKIHVLLISKLTSNAILSQPYPPPILSTHLPKNYLNYILQAASLYSKRSFSKKFLSKIL